jgi:hypothetical protein
LLGFPKYRSVTIKMSNNQYYSSSYSSVSYSSSSTSTEPTGKTTRFTQSSSTDPRGTTTHRTAEETGKQPYQETTYTPAGGRLESSGAVTQGRIEDVTDEQAERDKEYEERMEDAYAKREGGA